MGVEASAMTRESLSYDRIGEKALMILPNRTA